MSFHIECFETKKDHHWLKIFVMRTERSFFLSGIVSGSLPRGDELLNVSSLLEQFGPRAGRWTQAGSRRTPTETDYMQRPQP